MELVTLQKAATSVIQLVAAAAGTGVGGNLPTDELAAYVRPRRTDDPLGTGAARPPPPADPDPYDRARENAEFSRALLDEENRRAVDENIEQEGYMTIEQVRSLVAENAVKFSVEAGGLDPEMMALVDARVDYKIFVAGDNLYTREELYNHFPFHEFGLQPEAIFVQQEIGVFPPRRPAYKADELEYVARDAGDESVEMIALDDLVAKETRNKHAAARQPLRVVKTKIYVGKEMWEDFAVLQRFFRGTTRIAAAQIAYAGAVPSSRLAALPAVGSRDAPQAARPPLALLDAETLARIDADTLARQAALAQREDDLRRREDEHQRTMQAMQQKLDDGIKRLESLMSERAAPAPAPAH